MLGNSFVQIGTPKRAEPVFLSPGMAGILLGPMSPHSSTVKYMQIMPLLCLLGCNDEKNIRKRGRNPKVRLRWEGIEPCTYNF